jgi:hypothetical protein
VRTVNRILKQVKGTGSAARKKQRGRPTSATTATNIQSEGAHSISRGPARQSQVSTADRAHIGSESPINSTDRFKQTEVEGFEENQSFKEKSNRERKEKIKSKGT